MVAFARRSFSGSAPDSFLTSPMDGVTLTATCSNLTGWPDGSAGNFVVIFDPGTVNEEKCLASARTGNVLTLVARAYEESAVAHASSTCVVRHGYSAHDADEANNAVAQTIGAVAAKGDLLVGSAANTLTKVSVGSAGQALVVAGGTWAPGAPVVALTSASGTASDTALTTSGTTVITTSSLAIGTWLVSFTVLVLSGAAQSVEITLGAGTATYGSGVVNAAEVAFSGSGQVGTATFTTLLTVTVAGTVVVNGFTSTGTATAKRFEQINTIGLASGYTAIKVA